jgi:hypothetical protein
MQSINLTLSLIVLIYLLSFIILVLKLHDGIIN